MNITDLIRSGAIAATQDVALIQTAMNTLGTAINGVPDNTFGAAITLTKASDNFLAGQWGTFEELCAHLITLYSKKASESCPDSAETVMLPYIDIIWQNIAKTDPVIITCLTKQAIQRCNCDASWGLTDEIIKPMESMVSAPLCTFEFLNRSVGVLVKSVTNSDGTSTRKFTLITRSLDVLNTLYQYKMLVLGKGQSFLDIQNKLWGAKNNSDALAKEGKAYVVQLVCNRVVANPDGSRRPIFELRFTQGRIAMNLETVENPKTKAKTTTYIYPLSLMYAEERYLKRKLSTSAFEVTKETDFGDKKRIVTSNKKALIQLYQNNGVPNELIAQKANVLWGNSDEYGNRSISSTNIVGFDIVNLHYYFPDIEASVYEPTVFGIKPGAIKYIKKVDTDKISTVMYKVNPYIINQIFNTRVNRAVLADYDCLPEELGLAALKFRHEKRDQLISYGASLNDRELYMFITNPKYAPMFKDIPSQITHRTKTMARYLKNLTPVNTNAYTSLAQLRDSITKMLNSGVLRMTVLSNKHEVMEVMATNMSEILERTYGKNNIERYESLRSRLRMVASQVTKIPTGADGDAQIRELFEEYGIMDNCAELLETHLTGVPRSVLNGEINTYIAKLASRDSTLDENTIFYRIADGYKITTSSGQIAIIRQCNVSNIIKLAYAPYAKVVEAEKE